MGVWNPATPLGTDPKSQGDDRMREEKAAIQEALRGGAAEGTEAIFPGAAPLTAPVFRYRGLIGTTGARPAATEGGLYANTTLNTIQRANSSAWVDIATLIPSGTKMVFYQASPPTGWTAVAANDKFLRVVTSGGTGGTNGGTVAASTSLAHTHTVDSHTHTGPSHTHSLADDSTTSNADGGTAIVKSGGRLWTQGGGASAVTPFASHTTDASGTGNTGAATPGTDSQLGAFAYSDVIIATKD